MAAAAALVLVGQLSLACGASPSAYRLGWVRIGDTAFAARRPPGRLRIESLSAPSGSRPWLLGGDTVMANGTTHVAIWPSTSPMRQWRAAQLLALPGRDGPYEMILSFARRGAEIVALGSRAEEGYPRPSTWTALEADGTAWREALADRELFGGPSIVGLGNVTAGRHGFTIAGTWTGPTGRAVVAVWRSSDGSQWTRDDSDPFLRRRPRRDTPRQRRR